MARQLVESLASERFEPEKYRDEYREQVLDLIERKAAGEEIVAEPGGRGAGQGARPRRRARGVAREGAAAPKERHPSVRGRVGTAKKPAAKSAKAPAKKAAAKKAPAKAAAKKRSA